MKKQEKIQKFAEMLAAPDGTAWARIKENDNEETFSNGKTAKWKSYDCQMIYIKGGQLREVYWCYIKGIQTNPIVFHTDDIDYIAEFVQTDRVGILDAFDKFFYDGREARCSLEEEIKEVAARWREDNEHLLHFIK